MKTLIAAAAILSLSSGATMADWEHAWQNPDLTSNHEGYMVIHQSPTADPLERAFGGNGDLYAGGEGGDVFSGDDATSYDLFVRDNPDIDVCGCI